MKKKKADNQVITIIAKASKERASHICFRVGTSLWLERQKKKMTQEFLAKAVGIKLSSLQKMEAGIGVDHFGVICQIATVLSIPLWKLIKECEQFTNKETKKNG